MDALPHRSVAESVVWPAVPHPAAGAIMGLLFQLEQSEWWRPEELLEHQYRQLGLLVEHARRTVPHYRHRLKPLKGPMTPEKWRKIPILTRSDVQRAGERLNTRQLPESHGKSQEIFTSGSTGKPIRVLLTQLFTHYWGAITIREHLWHGRDFTGKFASIRQSSVDAAPYPDGETFKSWGWVSGLLFDTGPLVSLNITTPAAEQFEWLQRQNADYLLSHPTMLHDVAAHSLKTGGSLPALRQIITIAEILRPDTREICRKAWGVPLVDMYSTREAGYIALQCPKHDHYHVQSEVTFVEILDEAGEPCAPGEIGRVIVTPLHNFATPLIRYEVGDFAEVGAPCDCGRGLPVLTRVVGRERNMLVTPEGERRWPLLMAGDLEALHACAPIRQFQIVQKTVDLIELRLAVPRDLEETEEEALRNWVRVKFDHPFEVDFSYHDEILRSASGKYQDFLSEVA